eukprot:TRINITY_DN13203_c0_g1_i1.p1 TRINITY_DN13203_c0_g1~~TRINITY_DN13203_c0_g1_i1.p1  ORF type:complete len:316 (+),score=77.10 TRINITY_DN13203_c0_g1_i1:73-1020(+)
MASFRNILRVTTAHRQLEGGGFEVRRPLGGGKAYIDPFLMLDHLGPKTYRPGEAVGAPDHPHRGQETVTYLLQGSMQHRDSQGNTGNLTPGMVQWMTAGRGIVHSEMPSDEMMRNGGTLEGFQLWVNLPAKNKMMNPRYQDIPAEKIPEATTPDGKVTVRIVAGEALGKSAVIETITPIMFLDIRLQPGTVYVQNVPRDFDGFFYIYRGQGSFGSADVNPETITQAREGQSLLLGPGDKFTLRSTVDSECRGLLIAGVPIREKIVQHGPFVMNSHDEIIQAFEDYQTGKLGGRIEGEEERMAQTKAALAKQRQGS